MQVAPLSCRKLLAFPLEAVNLAFDAGVFFRQSSEDASRRAMSVHDHANVRTAHVELASDPALDVAGEFRPVGGSVHNVYGVHSEKKQYSHGFTMSRTNNAVTIDFPEQGSLAFRIKTLRGTKNWKQAQLAAFCGVSQVSVSQWESQKEKSRSVPSAKILLKLSELAPEADRQWWRDQAAEQTGFDLLNGVSSGPGVIPLTFRTIPLVKGIKGMDTLGTVAVTDVERNLHFPDEWFPEGGTIRAVRIHSQSAIPLIAMVDISRRDRDRLLGHIVAVQASEGIEVRWLKQEDGIYLLLPFQPDQAVKRLRTHGEQSIVGLVRWIGDEI
jgi:DNA-binding transcriptional regulator YiaG